MINSGCLLSRKVRWAVWIGSFWPKIEVFYRLEWTNGGTTWKWILSIFKFRNEYYNQTGKSRWKNGVIYLVSMLPSWVMVLKFSKKCIFCNFVLTWGRNISRLKQFTYMHLKGLVTHFQKFVLFIRLTVSEVWVFEVEEFLRNFCWFSIFFWYCNH